MTRIRRQRPLRRLHPGVVVVLCAVAGCGLVDTQEDEWREAYDDARALWTDAGLTDYRYVVRQLCFCGFGGQAIEVVVREGQVVSGTIVETGEAIDHNQWPYAVPSIDGLFDRIDEILDNDPHEFSASYDVEFGYPVSVASDPIENAIDEEWGVEAGGLEVIE